MKCTTDIDKMRTTLYPVFGKPHGDNEIQPPFTDKLKTGRKPQLHEIGKYPPSPPPFPFQTWLKLEATSIFDVTF